jgi:hypothetical protein
MTEALIRRLMAASHGHVAVDIAACPDWGPETITCPARGSWSPALQAMIVHEVGDEFGCCSACGRTAADETVFLSPTTIFATAAQALLRRPPASVPAGGVVYECQTCGSADLDFGLRARRDPITDTWIVEAIDAAGHVCLGCSSLDCTPTPRPLSAAEHQRARVELQRLGAQHAARARDVRRVLSFVSGART